MPAVAQSQSQADFTVLDPPSALSIQVVKVNDSGQAALDGIDKNGNLVHFFYSQGNFSTINFGSIFARVVGLNNSGQILYQGGDFTGHGCSVLVNPGVATICGPPTDNSIGARVYALNDSSQVAGTYFNAAGAERLFIYTAGKYATFDPPVPITPSGGILIGGMNASGQVAGIAEPGPGSDNQGFLLTEGEYITFGPPPGMTSMQVSGINDHGDVVGYALDENNMGHGFLYSKGGLTTIDYPGAASNGTILGVINDSGGIAGTYYDGSGATHGFLLSGGNFQTLDVAGSLAGTITTMNNSGEVGGSFFASDRRHHGFLYAPCVNEGGDTDGDGICDAWEENGIRDDQGNMLLNLPAMGADPKHKDIFVEIDYMDCALGGCAPGDNHTHFPEASALQDIVNAFDTAPVNSNPDGKPGIHLHFVVDEAIPEVPQIYWSGKNQNAANDFTGIKLGTSTNEACGIGLMAGHFGTQEERFSPDCQMILDARSKVFHYALIAHSLISGDPPDPISPPDPDAKPTFVGGLGEQPGNDLVIAPQNAVIGKDPLGYMESELMHELGHNLNLGHGGGDQINCKPNYLSIMNYVYAYRAIDEFRPLDYSGQQLPTLDKHHLNELLGVQGPPSRVLIFGFDGLADLSDPLSFPKVDWNLDGDYDEDVADLGINWINDFGCTGEGEQLEGHNDWASLLYDFRHAGAYNATFVPHSSQHELTSQEVAAIAQKYHPTQDTTAPTTTVSLTPSANAAGWNNTDVTVAFTASDDSGGSGPKEVFYAASGAFNSNLIVAGAAASLVISAEGTTTVTYFSRDNAGNAETPHTLSVRIDKTPPTIAASRSPQSNTHGWNNSDVTVSFLCSDALSGLAAGSPPSPEVIRSEGAGQSASGTCIDVAGNSASIELNDINIDKTPPTLACSAAPNVLWPPNNKLLPVNTLIALNDSLSGTAGFQLLSIDSNEAYSGSSDIVGWNVGTSSTSGYLNATRLGSGSGRLYTFDYVGTDKAGNSARCSPTVSVPHDGMK